ncbi:MAG: hypothetical protein ABIU54_00230 [Candidatus Eisenbacteria bacterium]
MALTLGALAALRFVAILLRENAYGIAKYYMADDAFYYFQIARNIATGLGPTFDGVHNTNGFHPLWLLISTGVFAFVQGSMAPLLVLYALQIGMLIGSAFMLFLAFKEFDRLSGAFTVALFLASWHTRKILFAGMESSLAFVIASGLLLLAVRRRSRFFMPASWPEAWGLLALLLALSLARLEAGSLAAAWLCVALVVDARHGSHSRPRILLVGLGLVVAGCAYVAWNLLLVGMALPISGLLKAGGHHSWDSVHAVLLGHRDAFIGLIAPPGGSPLAKWISIAEGSILAVALVACLVRVRRHYPCQVLGLILFLVFAIAFVAVSAFVTNGIWAWYRWPALLAGVLATFSSIHFVLAHLRPVRLALALLAVVTTMAVVPDWYLTLRPHPLADWSPLRGMVMDETVRFIREEIPPGERIGGVSNGIFTYFCGRQIENLEGLANGAAFYRARRDPTAYAAYLRENRIRWIIFHAWSSDDRAYRFKAYVPTSQIDRVYDLDSHYHLDLRRNAFFPDRPHGASLSEPNVYFVRLKP